MRPIRYRTTSLAVVLLMALGGVAAAQDGKAPTAFTAAFQPSSQIRSAQQSSEEIAEGVGRSSSRGSCWRPLVRAASDPRLDGRVTYCLDQDRYSHDGQSYTMKTGTFRIETDAGAWQGQRPFAEWNDPVSGERIVYGGAAVLAGEGDYAGLFAVMTFHPDWSDIRGFIVPGPPPMAPVPPVD